MVKDVLEAIDSRIKSPIFGYFVIALLFINWESFFFLLIDKGSAEARILYFHENTNRYSLIYIPALIAGIYAVAYPWITYFFMFLSSKPTELKSTLQLQSEHKLLSTKQELEQMRNAILSTEENELIDRATRDEKLSKIEDEAIRKKLQSEIEQLRRERDELGNPQKYKPDYSEYKQLMELADGLRERAKISNNSDDRRNYAEQARELENRAIEIVTIKSDNNN